MRREESKRMLREGLKLDKGQLRGVGGVAGPGGSPGPAAAGPLTEMWKGTSQGKRCLLPILGPNAKRSQQIKGVCELQRTPGQKELSSL